MTSRTCEVAECQGGVYARGLCGRHYKQQLRHGQVQPDPVPAACAVESCDRRAVTRGWCHGHYLRWSRSGDVNADLPLRRQDTAPCSVSGCARPSHARALCRAHLERQRLHGDPRGHQPIREVTAAGSFSHGYWKISIPTTARRLFPGESSALEHRVVMAVHLDRPLRPDEVVHHLNGDRLDNRLLNLELWCTAQPKGQRVADKVAFAYELLLRYDREASEALGLDLDPSTGLPRKQESPRS